MRSQQSLDGLSISTKFRSLRRAKSWPPSPPTKARSPPATSGLISQADGEKEEPERQGAGFPILTEAEYGESSQHRKHCRSSHPSDADPISHRVLCWRVRY